MSQKTHLQIAIFGGGAFLKTYHEFDPIFSCSEEVQKNNREGQ
jgi:hypothetical protein